MTDLSETLNLHQEPETVVEKEFTIAEIVEAIAHNGFDHLRGEWVEAFDGKIAGGCVLAQGAFNLGVLPDMNVLPYYLNPKNTEKDQTLVGALNQFENVSSKWHSVESGCGGAIIDWNDKESNSNYDYFLPTYEAVTEMVREILAPYMNEKVTLRVIDYGEWLAPKVPV